MRPVKVIKVTLPKWKIHFWLLLLSLCLVPINKWHAWMPITILFIDVPQEKPGLTLCWLAEQDRSVIPEQSRGIWQRGNSWSRIRNAAVTSPTSSLSLSCSSAASSCSTCSLLSSWTTLIISRETRLYWELITLTSSSESGLNMIQVLSKFLRKRCHTSGLTFIFPLGAVFTILRCMTCWRTWILLLGSAASVQTGWLSRSWYEWINQ